jgi:hypothetical protein
MADIGRLVLRARRCVVLVAPGLDAAAAAALVNAAKAIGAQNVRIVLDVQEENCRVGYGQVDGYSLLLDAGMVVGQCRGLRIGFVLSDDEGYLFGMPALMVEGQSGLAGCPNAVRATAEQIALLVTATGGDRSAGTGTAAPMENSSPFAAQSSSAEIGREPVSKAEVDRIEASIRSNPIQDFDLGRVVRVYSSYIQFVELEVKGANIENRTVKLPNELLTIIRDQATRDRFKAAFKIVAEDSKLSGDKIRDKANEIRKLHIRSHPVYGGVVLKAKRKQLEAEIEELRAKLEKHRTVVRGHYAREVGRSKADLIKTFWRAVRASPPLALRAAMAGEKPTMEEAKAYLAMILDKAFPDAEDICADMTIGFVTKDVTWETLNAPGFVAWLGKKFPLNKDIKKPFEEYRAARERHEAGFQMLKELRR